MRGRQLDYDVHVLRDGRLSVVQSHLVDSQALGCLNNPEGVCYSL